MGVPWDTADPMICTQCGAPARDEGAFCSHCGCRLPRTGTTTPGHLSVTAAERYEQAAAHPGYEAACKHKPAEPSHPASREAAMGFVIGLALIVLSIVAMSETGVKKDLVVLLFLPLLGVGAIVYGVVRGTVANEFTNAPVAREILVVVGEHTSVSGGGKNSPVKTTYYATLQGKDGKRREYTCEEWLAARVAPGDIGVAFLKADYFIDFVRIEV